MTDQPLDAAFEDDVARRAELHPHEPRLVGRLVALRVAMNHHFGAEEFAPFDHELAKIETALAALVRGEE